MSHWNRFAGVTMGILVYQAIIWLVRRLGIQAWMDEKSARLGRWLATHHKPKTTIIVDSTLYLRRGMVVSLNDDGDELLYVHRVISDTEVQVVPLTRRRKIQARLNGWKKTW